jgi:hypothetical protein
MGNVVNNGVNVLCPWQCLEVSSALHFAHRDAGQEKARTCALVNDL